MSDARAIATAQAVADLLNNHVFSEPFTAVRAYRARLDISALAADAALRVFVVPGKIIETRLSRVQTAEDYEIQVALIARLGDDSSADDARSDELSTLIESIRDYLRRRAAGSATYVSAEQTLPFSPERMEEERCFVSLARIAYRQTVQEAPG